MGISKKMVDTAGIEGARPTYDPMNFVTFREQELAEVGTVLPGDTCDKGALQLNHP